MLFLNELAWATATVSGPIAKLAVLKRDRVQKIVEASIDLAEAIGDAELDD